MTGIETQAARDRNRSEARASLKGALPDPLPIETGFLAGPVAAPASKSLTNRALILAAKGSGDSTLSGASGDSDDTVRLLAALRATGVAILEPSPGTLVVRPGAGVLPAPGSTVPIDVGNAGTTARFLLPHLAATAGDWRMDGSARMRERPIGELLEALLALGARIEPEGEPGRFPVRISGGSLRGGRVRLDASLSSQFLSALLLAAPALPGGLEVEVEGTLASPSYVALTESVLADFGIPLERDGALFRVREKPVIGRPIALEADWSGATYLVAAGALGGGPVEIRGLRRDSLQGDARFLGWARRMGVPCEWSGGGALVVLGGELAPVVVDAKDAPDAVPTLAVLAAFADGETIVRGAANLRVKESDRIAALVEGLRRLGADAEERADGLLVRGDPKLGGRRHEPVTIRTFDDHRIAMAFALAGLRRPGVRIENPACVSKSFPGFWSTLAGLRGGDGAF